MGAGSYALQSRSRNEPNLKPAARAHITEVDDTGSQDLMTIDKLADGQTVCERHLKVAIKPLISREMQLNADFNWIWINSKQLFS